MPAVVATLEFLADLPLYETEKPYLYLPGEASGIDPDDARLSNQKFESHTGIPIRDMRDHPDLRLNDCGFQFFEHHFSTTHFTNPSDVEAYKHETDAVLKKHFAAEKVVTYEVKLRRNQDFGRRKFDLNDKMLREGPAKGAHNDVTYDSGPIITRRHLPPEDQTSYLRPGYRVRIFNTWRPLLSVLEDRPLALCDSRSIDPVDLIAADRIAPDRVGEIYYLRHHPAQQWYWLEKQKSSEPFVFLMYDTLGRGGNARFCPHVSFDNPRTPAHAEARSSVETRSIVITKVDD